jgi:transposase
MKIPEKSKLTRYSNEEKSQVTTRMFPPENATVTKLTKETGISKATLSKWKLNATNSSGGVTTNNNIDKRSSGEKFLAVIESYAMNELDFSAYCREKGLYTEEVKAWREMCFKANAKNDVNRQEQTNKELLAEISKEKMRYILLEKELNRKEKALAEAAAILMLRKKAEAIWETKEDE